MCNMHKVFFFFFTKKDGYDIIFADWDGLENAEINFPSENNGRRNFSVRRFLFFSATEIDLKLFI